MSASVHPLEYREPTTGAAAGGHAQSALGLRLALASFGVAAFMFATVIFAVDGVPTPLVVITSFGIPATLFNVVTVLRRLRAET